MGLGFSNQIKQKHGHTSYASLSIKTDGGKHSTIHIKPSNDSDDECEDNDDLIYVREDSPFFSFYTEMTNIEKGVLRIDEVVEFKHIDDFEENEDESQYYKWYNITDIRFYKFYQMISGRFLRLGTILKRITSIVKGPGYSDEKLSNLTKELAFWENHTNHYFEIHKIHTDVINLIKSIYWKDDVFTVPAGYPPVDLLNSLQSKLDKLQKLEKELGYHFSTLV